MLEIILKGLDETEEFGLKLGNILKGGDVISLIGDLGAGKTTLTKSIAMGLGVRDYVTSPTFTLINEYKGKQYPLYHFDVYRLEGIEDILDLGFEEYFYSKGVTIIEWGNKIKNALPEDVLIIKMKMGLDEHERILHIYGTGDKSNRIVEELMK